MGYTEKIEKSKYIHYRNRGSGFPLFHKINYNITWTENMSTSHKHSHRKNWNFGCRITWYFRRGYVLQLHCVHISSTIRTRKMRRITRSFLCRTLNGNPPSYARLCRVGGRSMTLKSTTFKSRTFKSETRPDTHFVDRFTVSNGALS